MASSGGGGIQFDPAELEQEPYDPGKEGFDGGLSVRKSSTHGMASFYFSNFLHQAGNFLIFFPQLGWGTWFRFEVSSNVGQFLYNFGQF